MRHALLLVAAAAVATGSAAAVCAVRADATPREPRAPCHACTLDVAASAPRDPVPLVVVLHGNHEDAEDRAKQWREAVTRRGWALLALDCPAKLGCEDGIWYQWNGDPAWVREQVRELAETMPIDMSRVYVVGWSGGATYLGKHVQAWPSMFAAIVIHGGGVPPRDGDDCVDRAFPAYFLVGDKNPAHGGSKRLRAYFQACKQQHVWDLLPGADHKAESEALTPAKADEILRWLASRRRLDAWS